MMRVFSMLALIIVLGIGAVIGFSNSASVTLSYIFGQVQMPLILLLLAEFFIVALLTAVMCSFRILGLHGEIRQLKRQLKDSQAELTSLRSLPLHERADDRPLVVDAPIHG